MFLGFNVLLIHEHLPLQTSLGAFYVFDSGALNFVALEFLRSLLGEWHWFLDGFFEHCFVYFTAAFQFEYDWG